jgi:hypothetical protein
MRERLPMPGLCAGKRGTDLSERRGVQHLDAAMHAPDLRGSDEHERAEREGLRELREQTGVHRCRESRRRVRERRRRDLVRRLDREHLGMA